MQTSYIFTTFVFFFIIAYINIYDKPNKKKEEIQLYIFDIVSILFLCLFLFYGYIKGTKYGLCLSIFVWSIFVCTTPIPEAGLLLSFPLKHFFHISMEQSQIIISAFALGLLYLFYKCTPKLIDTIYIGKMFHKIIRHKLFSLFAYSILASIAGAYLLDVGIDVYFLQKKEKIHGPILWSALTIMVLFNVLYFYTMKCHKIALVKH